MLEQCLIWDTVTDKLMRKLSFLLYGVVQKIVTLFSAPLERSQQIKKDQAEVYHPVEQILTTYGDSILRFAYSYLHNMSDAEDVLQDTLIQFLKAGPVFESEQHKKAWLMRVAGNLSKNRLTYNKVRMVDELNEELTADGREDLSFVWEAVKELPNDLRETIHLFYYEGYSTKEIAEILQKKEATVRTHLYRGREKLREILKGEYDFEETI
ncbi:MAG: RNA polymerase sigma factor [Lawsonibacter sp.]|jgi:RNA polymerase sigma factor (sigma-70 family)